MKTKNLLPLSLKILRDYVSLNIGTKHAPQIMEEIEEIEEMLKQKHNHCCEFNRENQWFHNSDCAEGNNHK